LKTRIFEIFTSMTFLGLLSNQQPAFLNQL